MATPGSRGTGMPSFNRNNPSNYLGSNAGPPPPPPPPPTNRNSFGSMRDNFNSSGGSWDNQGGMPRMNTENPSYNQPSTSAYNQQGGYNTSASGFNASMPLSSTYSQGFNPMGQTQPPPPHPQQTSMMNFDMYNNNPNVPYNSNPTQAPASTYMQPPPLSYGQNQQQGFGDNPNNFGGMNNSFNLAQTPPSGNIGYNNTSSAQAPFDNSNSYGIISQNYGSSSYNNVPQQQSRGGGPMRGGRR